MSDVEAKVYVALLRLGKAKAGAIAREARLNRTSAYDGLKRLLEKGLAGYRIESGRKVFSAAEPGRLVGFLKEKEEYAEESLPLLKAVWKQPKGKYNVTLYYGNRGVKSMFLEFVRGRKPICVFDSESQFTERMPDFAKFFVKQVEKYGIPIRHLVREGVDVKPSRTTQVRYVKRGAASDAVMNIFGDKISIILWSDPPEGVIIESKAAADAFRNYFEIIWRTARA
ncbi:MAG: helix-turn-helix domain-containing protein [Candidatus Aenigmatarchaeota archaeon]